MHLPLSATFDLQSFESDKMALMPNFSGNDFTVYEEGVRGGGGGVGGSDCCAVAAAAAAFSLERIAGSLGVEGTFC